MRAASPRLSAGIALLLLLLPASAVADDERDETTRWIASLSVSFAVLGQPSSGSVASDPISGDPLPAGCVGGAPGALCTQPNPSPALLTPSSAGNDTATAPLVGGSFELMTPRLAGIAGRPRLFAHVDAEIDFAFERKLAGEGKPGGIGLPPAPPLADPSITLSELTITGQGNRALSDLRSPVLSAGAGVALTFDLLGRRVRVKPSVEYLRQELDFTGIASRAIQLTNNPLDLGSYRQVSLRVEKSQVQHGIGGGLELEADTRRLGPFVLSVFGSGRVYHILGDLDETLQASTPSGETVTWTFEPESTAWRGTGGVRFRFVPK